MTEILCNWLNNEVKLSKVVDKANVANDFSTGYLFGEILHHFQLQDDFDSFSAGQSSNTKMYNFMRLEPTFHLLEIPFDANIAYDVMSQKYGVATRLLYQLYISLQRKVKNNLTGVAMQTMRPAAPVKLESIESGLYKERLKTLIPRESDLTMDQVTAKFVQKRGEIEKKALAKHYKEQMEYATIKEEQRKKALEKSRLNHLHQTEMLAKIQAAVVHIPKPPPSKTLQAIKSRRELRSKHEAESTRHEIRSFEDNLKKLIAPTSVQQGGHEDEDVTGGFDYLDRIKTRLSEERVAREERAKRRRKVLVDQMKAHHAQEEAHRQEQIVQRLMRQSQMERRVAVQLMQVRAEKDNIRRNRIFREKQYEERRLKDFQDALDLEEKLAKIAKQEYEENAAEERERHNQNMARKRQEKYRKHYKICGDILSGIIDFASKIIEYRHLTEKKVPEKLIREWKSLFREGQPIYEDQEDVTEDGVASKRIEILNSQDFAEYCNMIGEWKPDESSEFQKPPSGNILGHILHRLFNLVHPPEAPSQPPQFPDFPIRAAITGKMFSGKSTIVERITKSHNIAHLKVEALVNEAIHAFKIQEPYVKTPEEQPSCTQINIEGPSPAVEGSRQDLNTSSDEENEKENGGEKEKTQLSKRADLGKQALKYLESGVEIPDTILVDILAEEIHKIPEGRGWILDGFPTTVQQGILLEKAITGNDVSTLAAPVKRNVSKTSSLVADPNPPKPPVIATTALDVVLVLDISDDFVLKRSLGRTQERRDETEYHEEFSPAPHGSRTGLGKAEKVYDVEDKAFDSDQVQNRISKFHDDWKKLEGFYSKLSTVQHIDGEKDRDVVFEDAEEILFRTLEKIKGSDDTDASLKSDDVEEEPKEEPPPPQPKPASETSRASSPKSKGSKAPSPSGSRKAKSPKGRDKSSEKGKKSRSPSGSRKGSGKSKKSRPPTPVAEPPQEEVQGPPPPKPGDADWVYVDEPVSMEVAKFTVPIWDNIEDTYKSSCRHIFTNIRQEREIIVRYIYQSRNDFRAHLRRPDPKQTFVDAWQKDFNDVADDIRDDDETKAELHQRLFDLKERLWDICDTKKEEAESERKELINDGWLQDHLGLLINQYLSLMQVELDRFHSTTKVLKDYYSGMQNKIPAEDSPSNTRLPLVELDVEDPAHPASSSETIGSELLQESASDTKKKKGKEEEIEIAESDSHLKIPLIQRGASFTLTSEEGGKGKKGKAPEATTDTQLGEGELEEKTIVDAYNNAVGYITSLVQNDIAAKEAEVEEERRLKEEEEKAKMAAAAPASDKKGGGKKKSAKGKKGGKSKTPTPVPPSPVDEISEEDKKKMEIAKNMREEYYGALQEEETRVKCNLALIRYRGVLTLSDLKESMSTSYAEMLDWSGARYLAEMKAIDQLTDAGQHAIESSVKLKNQLCLKQDEFVVNVELKVARTPSPPPIPAPVEVNMPEVFTVVQLTHLLHQFQKVSPSGTIASKCFTELISDSALLTYGEDALPEAWLTVTYSQLVELCNLLSPESEYIDWRKFLLAVSKPWATPTMEQLIQARNAFQDADVAQNGWITEDQYTNVGIWLCETIPQEESDINTYPRMKNLHNFFFHLFSDWEQTPPRLDYVNMLMYFAMDFETLQGYVKALSVAVGENCPRVYKTLPTASSSSKLMEPEELIVDASVHASVKADSDPKPLIPVEAWWLVMHHGSARLADSHRFSITDDPDDKYSLQRIKEIYETLEAENLAPQPLQLLLQHPLIQDAIATTKQFQLPDISVIFDRPTVPTVDADDSQSIQASIS